MKRIVIISHHMITGGVERALISMLKKFDYSQVEIDLYLEHLGGKLFDEIPKEVKCYKIPTVGGKDIFRHPLKVLKKFFILRKMSKKKLPFIEQCYFTSKMLLPLKKEYDVAISYHAPNTVPVFYTIDGIKAGKKILWLHGDMETNGGNTPVLMKYHEMYDKVYAVGKGALDSFVGVHPDMKEKTEIFHNFVDIESILVKSQNGASFDDGFQGTRLLSIGRLDPQKGFDIAIESCKMLVEKGYDFRWYICGEGNQREELENLISEYKLENHFILLGNQSNPYTFLKDCNLYVQPSRFEGYCTTTNEARMLNKPVVTTDVSGAREQFQDCVTGWIVPIDATAIAERIAFCLDNPKAVREICDRMKNIEFQSADNINRIFD